MKVPFSTCQFCKVCEIDIFCWRPCLKIFFPSCVENRCDIPPPPAPLYPPPLRPCEAKWIFFGAPLLTPLSLLLFREYSNFSINLEKKKVERKGADGFAEDPSPPVWKKYQPKATDFWGDFWGKRGRGGGERKREIGGRFFLPFLRMGNV